jgi:hypothetical protein
VKEDETALEADPYKEEQTQSKEIRGGGSAGKADQDRKRGCHTPSKSSECIT